MRGAAGTGAASPSPSAAVSPPATAAAALDSTLSRDSDGRWADAGLALALLRWLDGEIGYGSGGGELHVDIRGWFPIVGATQITTYMTRFHMLDSGFAVGNILG